MGSIASRLTAWKIAAVVAGLGLCIPQQARAGDGADLAGLQADINDICSAAQMTNCPQLPTIAQAILQLAAFLNVAPEGVRSATATPVASAVDSGNPSRPPAVVCSTSPCADPLNPLPVTGLPIGSDVLQSLRPLAFVAASSGTGAPQPTRLDDASANAFLYAAGGTTIAGSAGPDTLVLVYDSPTRTKSLGAGQVVAKMSLPLIELNKDGTESPVNAVLRYQVPATGPANCSASTVTGNFSGSGTQTMSPGDIGVGCAVVFGPSPAQPLPHAIFQVSVRFLINSSYDSIIIQGNDGTLGTPFLGGERGFPFSFGKAIAIGIGPNAAPLGPGATTSATYALCASLPTGGGALLPSVSAFYSVSGDGEVLLSAPLSPTPFPFVCPAM
jgi:hypothetical protein